MNIAKLAFCDGYEHKEVRGIWIHGKPGLGKSYAVRQAYGKSLYSKPQSKWFDGYNGERTILLDDLDTNILGHYLKIWADCYACIGEIKGLTVNLLHHRFVVTSNYSIEELFNADTVMAEAVARRFQVFHMRKFREELALPRDLAPQDQEQVVATEACFAGPLPNPQPPFGLPPTLA